MIDLCRKVPVWAQLLIWHVLCGGILVCTVRAVFTLLTVIFGGPRKAEQEFAFLKFELNPINRVLIYTHKYSERDYCAIGCIFCQLFFHMPIMLVSVPSAILCVIFTFGQYLKYHANRVETGVLGLEFEYGYDIIHKDDLPNARFHNKMMEYRKEYQKRRGRHYQPPDFSEYVDDKYKKKNNSNNTKLEGLELNISKFSNKKQNKTVESKEVKQWFQNNFMENIYYDNYYRIFMENGLDSMLIVKGTTLDDLVTIGIKKLGHRKRIKMEIDKLNGNGNRNNSNNINEGIRNQQITYQ